MRLVLFITLVLFFIGCSEKSPVFSAESGKQKTILIQPFEDVGNEQVKNIAENIRKIYPHIEILKPIPFPENSYYKPRNRYRADTIIKYQQKISGPILDRIDLHVEVPRLKFEKLSENLLFLPITLSRTQVKRT